jgi:hypothetical protein
MKHLMRYEGYTSKERLDDILDKISKYGIDSLNDMEKQFLDSHKSGQEEEIHNKIARKEVETVFEDDHGHFKFEHSETEDFGDEVHYIGTMYVPDLTWPNEKRVEGRLCGKIIANMQTGEVVLDFENDDYDIYEFCNGLEYELDSFVDYVVSELSEKS